ncbi:MAG: TlpA disulfide reductase family protein [Persephonella sp.]|nr:TlpA disulfide reductase family protein [Persephonella sp.]
MRRLIIIFFAIIPSLALGKGLRPYMFQLKDENGKTVSLEQLKGNVIYLIFWSKNCHTCREELPQINRLYRKFKDRNVKFFAVIIDEKNRQKIKQIKKQWGFSFPVLVGNDVVKSKYRIIGTPITYILRKDLTIGKIIYGAYSLKKLEKYINRFLEEKR